LGCCELAEVQGEPRCTFQVGAERLESGQSCDGVIFAIL